MGVCVLMLLLPAMGCGREITTAPLPPPVAAPAATHRTSERLQAVLENPGAYAGKTIAAEGVFLGWSGRCPRSAPVARSDWILEDGTGCIYVTGRIPAGVSAVKPKRERLLVTGTINMTKDGKAFFQAASVKILP